MWGIDRIWVPCARQVPSPCAIALILSLEFLVDSALL